MAHAHFSSCGCHQSVTAPSTVQTLNELDFERGIWSAALNGEVDRIKKFLSSGVDPRILDSSGYSALHYAARNGHVEICRLLLDHGACANAVTRSGNVTPLHRAAYSGQTEVVELLLKRGANVCLQDTDGKTALHKAVERDRFDIAKALAKSDPRAIGISDCKGRVACHYALSSEGEAKWQALLTVSGLPS